MKHIRVIAAIVMCMVAGSVEAKTEEVFALSFNGISVLSDFVGWTFVDCAKPRNYNYLEIRDYAITPSINSLEGDVTITINCRTESNYTNRRLKVSVIGDDDAFETISVSSSSYQETKISLKSVSGTQIKLEALDKDCYIIINKFIVTAESVSAPTFSPSEGYFTENQTVTITIPAGTLRYKVTSIKKMN